MRRLKELLSKVNQHLLVVVEGSISMQHSCLPAAGCPWECSSPARWAVPAVRGTLEKEWAFALLKHTDLLRLLGPPQCPLSPHPLLLSPTQTHMVTHALGRV